MNYALRIRPSLVLFRFLHSKMIQINRHILLALSLCCIASCITSCVDVEEYSNTTVGNTEALWHIMDEHYCFFEEKKQQLGVDWDEVHARYMQQAQAAGTLSPVQLLEFLGGMVAELKDGHVNISTSFDYARNWSWKDDYLHNFDEDVQKNYLGTDYRISCGISYRILDDNTGYVYVPTFENTIGDGNIDEILLYLAPCNKLIIDVRDNGGGLLTQAQKLAARFCQERTLVGYMCHKTGSGRSDFSPREEQWIEPSAGLRWHKPVMVLTNRSVYSAANEYVKYMKCMPYVTVIGDNTGGGSGMPYSSELPNGWGVRYSACPMYDADGGSTEDGVAPDVKVDMEAADVAKGMDTMIEYARSMK